MSKYHVNPESGEPGDCGANKGNCPFRGENGLSNHFETQEEAEAAGQKILQKKYGKINSLQKERNSQTLTINDLRTNQWFQLLPRKNAEQVFNMIKTNTNENDTEFIKATQGIKNPDAVKLRSKIRQRIINRIQENPAEWKQGQKAAARLTERDSNENRRDYIASIDRKHFEDNGGAGSKFTDPRVKKTEDVIALTIAQRGGLKGDDRDKLIANGADPNAFLPPETGVRYLQVKVTGTEATKDTSTMSENEVLTVTAKQRGNGSSSLSISADVKNQPKTEYATVIIGPKDDANGDAIEGTTTLWTMHPGSPTRGIRSNDLREKGLDDGSKITVGELRKLFGKDIKANTRLVD